MQLIYTSLLKRKNSVSFIQSIFLAGFFLLLPLFSFSAAISWDGGGDGVNWSSQNNWSGNVLPTNADDVTIPSGNAITVDMAAVCGSLTIGNGTNSAASVTISGANSLNITTAGGRTGQLSMNPSNNAKAYSIDVGGGTLTVGGGFIAGVAGNKGCAITVSSGTISFTSVAALTFPKGTDITITGSGTVSFAMALTLGACASNENSNLLLQSTGQFTFTGLVTLSDADNTIQNTGTAGTFNFNGGFTLSAGGTASFVTMAGTTAKFGGNFTVSGSALVFDPNSTANFNAGTPTITPTAAITFGNVTLSAGTTTLAGNIIVAGDWSNTGGTLTAAGFTITFSGASNIISGTSSTAFGPIVIAADANYTMNNSNSCTTLTFTASGTASSLSLGAANPTLTISGAVTINQPTAAVISSLNINGGTCTVAGALSFVGTSATAGTVGQMEVTTGSFTANGAVTFDSNTNDDNQVITVAGSGSATFNSTVRTTGQTDLRDGKLSVTGSGSMTFAQFMDMRGGTISIGASGTANFNKAGATAFSLTNTSVPAFTTNFGSTINFGGNMTVVSPALVLADGSTSIFTANATITPTSAITFGNFKITGGTTTLAGNISVTDDWTNTGGTLAGNFTVTFNGTGTQTITKAGGTETFYGLTTNTTGPLTLAATTDVTVTNTLTMTAGNYNLNGRTLQLGSGAVATLVRTAGIMYSNTGVFKRYLASGTAMSSTVAPLYGLFPVGTTTDYRPVEINSTVSPTTSGYISVTHYDPPPPSYVTDVVYTDNEAAAIQRISTIVAKVSTSGGFAGGTYNINVTFSQLSTVGLLTDLKLETYTGSVMGSVGTTVATAGSVSSPVGKRSGLTAANLANDFVIGTKDKTPTGTPIRQYYYSRKNGNWNDVTAGNSTWSYTAGGAGASCNCIPVNDGYAVISTGQTVTANVAVTTDYIDISTGATMDGTAAVTINKDLRTAGSGKFTPTAGAWTITRDAFLVGTGSCSLAAASTVTGDLNIGSGTILTMSGGAGLTVTGNLVTDGTLALGTSTLTFNGAAGKTISNTSAGSITGAGSTLSITTASKSISAGTSLSIASTFAITGAITVTNNGTVTTTGNITGSVAGSTWTNAANSVLNVGGALLTTGTLNASAGPNTVNYNAAGNQTIKTPSSNYYDLTCSVSGTKSMGTSISVSDNVTISGSAILDEAAAANDLTGTAALTMTGTSEFIDRNATNGSTEPQLTGVYTLTGGTVTINSDPGNGSKSTTVYGATYYNLNLIGNNQHKMLNVSSITNNFTVGATVDFNDNVALTVGGTTTYSSTSSSTLADDLTTGAFLISAGTLDDGGKNIAITGSGWTKNGGTFTTTGTVSFTGTAAQTIAGTASTSFNNLTFNNTFATSPQITLAVNTTALGTLTMTKGIVNLAGFTFTLGASGGTSTLARTASATSNWMYGGTLVRGWKNATAITSTSGNYYGLFPMGESGASSYSPFEINTTVSPTANGTFSVLFTQAFTATDLSPVCPDGASNIDRLYNGSFTTTVAGVTGGTYNIDLTLTGLNPAGALSDLRLAVSTGGTTAAVVGTNVLATGTVANPTVHRTGLTIANLTTKIFKLGTINKGVTALPVQFLALDAMPSRNTVDVKWSTASEFNSDYFIVQHSKDGLTFEDVTRVKAAGNSSTVRYYSSVDTDSYNGVSYYRIKQFDFDGRFMYSNIVVVNMMASRELSIYPNPASGPFNLVVPGVGGEKTLIVIRDVLGKEFYSSVMISSGADDIVGIDPSGKMAPGVYMIIATSNDAVYQKKLIIK